MKPFATGLIRLTIIGVLCELGTAYGATISTPGGLSVRVDEASGAYEVSAADVHWSFAGTVNGPLTSVTVQPARDGIGAGQEIAFAYAGPDKTPLRASIRIYDGRPVALFTQITPQAASQPLPPAAMFPAFTALPANLHAFSHRDTNFSPPAFALTEHSMPWVLFDDAANTWILSPASHFLAARLSGDGKTLAASGLNAAITAIPAGFEQRTLLAVGQGINRTWESWGHALTDLQGKVRPANDADIGLKYFGYWTDNGATYYYNYDADKGYAGTLLALADHYRQQHIPLGYMQLDSWWYYKSLNDPKGAAGRAKNARLPAGEWNRYGGLLDYTAHKDLFPDGLAAFQKKLGLPLITHNRWIDRASPYHDQYKITGVATVDPRWWDDITGYLKSSGVITYEQDWLNEIYNNSPELGGTVDQGDAFMDNMARACKDRGLTMQYCMPLPCHILQGSKYDNLTTTRVSDDNFIRARWTPFLFTSRLAGALGIWPWTDVFRSTDRDAVLLANLSGGMVGVGDGIGRENRANIMQAIRADGVIIKPDAPLVPTDETYLAQAAGQRDVVIGSTYSDSGAGRTAYVFAYSASRAIATARFTPAKLGIKGDCYVHDVFADAITPVAAGAEFSSNLAAGGASYFIVAPVGVSGIALLGDQGKFISMGRQRITSVKDEPGRMTIDLLLVDGDAPMVLHGYTAPRLRPGLPRITLQNGAARSGLFDDATRHFTVEVSPSGPVPPEGVHITVVLEPRA